MSETPHPTPTGTDSVQSRLHVLRAVGFAARAHRHQLRKDQHTPYASHTFRVCLILRDLFGIDDPDVLCAGLLHDTIEDTTTDFDDIREQFGEQIAGWVAALSKDMRLPDEPREQAYRHQLAGADWPVIACKLADILDNLLDTDTLPPDKRARHFRRAGEYLDAISPALPEQLQMAYEITRAVQQRGSGA